jgi:hypothetical protein
MEFGLIFLTLDSLVKVLMCLLELFLAQVNIASVKEIFRIRTIDSSNSIIIVSDGFIELVSVIKSQPTVIVEQGKVLLGEAQLFARILLDTDRFREGFKRLLCLVIFKVTQAEVVPSLRLVALHISRLD